jgi:hypothetical protein
MRMKPHFIVDRARQPSKMRLYGGGPPFVKIGRRVVYDPSDLDRWLEANRRGQIGATACALNGADAA